MPVLRLLLCTLLLAATANAGDNGLSFSHHDWELACDNTRTCRAAGYPPETGEAGASLLLTRHAGPGQPISAELQLADEEHAPASDLHLHINGRDLGPLGGPGEQGGQSLSRAQSDALLAALVRDSVIQLRARDGWHLDLPDRGAAAVLLKMDEFQGRLGTPGALVRKGNRAETSVLPPLPAPRVVRPALAPARPGDAALAHSPELRVALLATLDQHAGDIGYCDRFTEHPADAHLQVERLDDRTLLVSTDCWLAAYNAGSGYWLVNDHAPFQPRLLTTDANHHEAGMLGASHKGRGIGDCWSGQQWTWDGSTFVPTSMYDTGMCRGMPGGFWRLPSLVSEVVEGD